MRRAPLIGLPSDRTPIGRHQYQAVGEKYIRAVIDGAGGIPLLIPSLTPASSLRELLGQLDGLFLTGAYSNIEPHHYSDEPSYPGNLHDPSRDATTLALVPMAIEMRLPVLAVCRGLQEVNVGLGGTLHQEVHAVQGFDDHREDEQAPLDEQYGPSHFVRLSGTLERLAGSPTAAVNSLHGQGVDKLGSGLVVEATAPDGLVEGVRLDSDDSFLIAVQWHPEWKVRENPFYLAIFEEFAAACRARAALRD